MNANGISPAAKPESTPRRSMSRVVVACMSAFLAATVLAMAALTAPLAGAAVPPSYQLQYLGPGTPVGISNGGVVIGTRIVGNAYQPLVSVGGAPWSSLPVLRGAVSVFPTDVNDGGVIVGVSFNAQFNAVAVRWKPTPAGYVVEELPRLPGDPSSYATGINNMGEIVGARRTLGYVPAATTGWLYSDALGVVDLSTFGLAQCALRTTGGLTGDWLLIHGAADGATIAIYRGRHPVFFRRRAADGEAHLGELVHQTAMYYQDRLGGSGFGRVLAGGVSAPELTSAAWAGIQARLGVRADLVALGGGAPVDAGLAEAIPPAFGMAASLWAEV